MRDGWANAVEWREWLGKVEISMSEVARRKMLKLRNSTMTMMFDGTEIVLYQSVVLMKPDST
jgi:hypothetical protein